MKWYVRLNETLTANTMRQITIAAGLEQVDDPEEADRIFTMSYADAASLLKQTEGEVDLFLPFPSESERIAVSALINRNPGRVQVYQLFAGEYPGIEELMRLWAGGAA